MPRRKSSSAIAFPLRLIGKALIEAEARARRANPNAIGLALKLFCEGSGMIEKSWVIDEQEEDPYWFIFYSFDELLAWAQASPAERLVIENRERAKRAERDARDFAKLDLLFAATGRPV